MYPGMKSKAVGGGRKSTDDRLPGERMHYLKALELLWKMVLVILKYGNAEISFHICAAGDKDGSSWRCPMNAENVEVRDGYAGKYVTIF
jgi:hypothetical protein